ncbi:DUF3152 domain-containing protein [Winogradskya humida]|uniref:DUF3152 domain-containing protein n=1 Tax=Winogradskya humida TaxID=113566 RepID=A0ABQ3ZKX8_9ACTN|nr:DUF3152 domain-containing protein [Actinoplanes humidus]GIE19250.1 hypothetical protein Ahu01nite_023520 [Actinoplanes humidus]
MIDTPTPDAVTEAPEPGTDRRRWWLAAMMVVVVLLVGGLLLPTVWSSTTSTPGTSGASAGPAPSPVISAGVLPSAAGPSDASAAGAAPSAGAVPPTDAVSSAGPGSPAGEVSPEAVTALPGAVPTRGTGTFDYAQGWSKIFGTSGTMRRFHVAVEKGSNEDLNSFATQVEAILGDDRSWIGDGRLRLQRVPGNVKASFTVYLATRETAGRMCRIGGVAIDVGGRPYTSCRSTGRAIINLDRWRLSAQPYISAKITLAVYRQYVINHEVGHELGRHHEGCPKRGGPAPVMVQQTLTLRGCIPYPWPRRDGNLLQGPPV